MTNDMDKRLDFIDMLKGLAIIGVILVHFNGAWSCPSHIVGLLTSIGARCPQLFLIISAFLTWKSINKKRIVDFKSFWKSRFVKLVPLFYIALTLSCFVPEIKIQNITFANGITHMLFFNGLFPEYINSIMGVEWYIADLALFYFMVPLLHKVAYSLKSSIILFGCSVVISIVFTIITNRVWEYEIANNTYYEMFFHTFCIIVQLPIILLGVLIYYVNEHLSKANISSRKLLFVFGITILLILVAFIIFNLNKRFITSSLIAGLLFSWVVFLLITEYKYVSWGRYFQALGKHSYGIYCFHIIVVRCAVSIPFACEQMNNLVLWIVTAIGVVCVSYIISVICEKLVGIK